MRENISVKGNKCLSVLQENLQRNLVPLPKGSFLPTWGETPGSIRQPLDSADTTIFDHTINVLLDIVYPKMKYVV